MIMVILRQKEKIIYNLHMDRWKEMRKGSLLARRGRIRDYFLWEIIFIGDY